MAEYTSEPCDTPTGGFWSSSWIESGKTAWARNRVLAEFTRWVAEVKDSRLAEKANELWQMLLDGGLTCTNMAIVISALLYCISPFDLCPDFIIIVGLIDDLLIVLSVLSYLGHKD